MKLVSLKGLLAGVLVLAFVAPAGAQDGPATIWKFLGIPKGTRKVRDALVNRRGNHPGLESKPPLKNIADPAFLEAEIAKGVPTPKALQEAAKVKIQEDLAPQKIKAVKYLTSIGCGCYNDDGAITEALVEALGDCTPEVRQATIEAIAEVAQDEACTKCGTRSCCEEAILLKLAEIAYERDSTGCYKEPNEEIRQAAIEALEACCPSEGPIITEGFFPDEGVETPPVPEVTPETPNTTSTNYPAYDPRDNSSRRSARGPQFEIGDQLPTAQVDRNPETMAFTGAVLGDRPEMLASHQPGQVRSQLPPPEQLFRSAAPGGQPPVFPGSAFIGRVDTRGQVALVTYEGSAFVPVGTQVEVFHQFILGTASVGQYEVIQSGEGTATIRPLPGSRIQALARGDEVKFLR